MGRPSNYDTIAQERRSSRDGGLCGSWHEPRL